MKSKTITYQLALSGVFIALGVLLSTFSIPIAGAKCYPVQHLINVLGAVFLGPFFTVMNAFLISLLRNLMGLGTPLAFPGSMVGALLASIIYLKSQNYKMAVLGEVIGTGIIGALIAAPLAIILLGKEVGIFAFVLPFLLSTFVGSAIAFVLLETTHLIDVLRKQGHSS